MATAESLTFALTVTASPFSSDQQERALRFARAVQAAGHRISQVFFYHEGVLAAHPDSVFRAAWTGIAEQARCELFVCVSAAERRGLHSLDTPWQIVGLGDWLAGVDADRHLHFGG